MGEDRADAHRVGRGGDRLTIAEAATLLGVHKNTVRNRIKDGTYKADKVITERGPTYLIEREILLANLNTNTLSSASQQIVNPAQMEIVQEMLRPFIRDLESINQELGAERVRRRMAEERAAALEAELQELREARETPEKTPVNEANADPDEPPPDASAGTQEATGSPQTGESAERRSWWRRFFGF
ncbi:MAG: helix-turn-helix domain-containing protein [Actinomycetota bacterium]|nr:helix-turn-helix domain-containing protein [Actinomycetota bacterium]